ncbi:TetR family transcriptional regulator, partial [Streptomyces tendae]|uniref:TetR/AcrR family transcriptional regulator n=1 Tax=Streptomyces tendae TaxID=1932 RepID=UPI0033A03D94
MVGAGAALADEVGLAGLTMGLLADRVGVRTPSLYKHVAGQDDLIRRIAALALDEAADAVGGAVQGRAGSDALAVLMAIGCLLCTRLDVTDPHLGPFVAPALLIGV